MDGLREHFEYEHNVHFDQVINCLYITCIHSDSRFWVLAASYFYGTYCYMLTIKSTTNLYFTFKGTHHRQNNMFFQLKAVHPPTKI